MVLPIALERKVLPPSSAETERLDPTRVPSNTHNVNNRRSFMTRDAAQFKIDFTLRPYRPFINTNWMELMGRTRRQAMNAALANDSPRMCDFLLRDFPVLIAHSL